MESRVADQRVPSSGTGGQPRSERPIRALLLGNFISDLGNTFSSLAIPWFVLATGGGGGKVALTVAVGTIPYVLVGIFGGAIVDRIGPKRAAVLSDAFSGISTALIPLLHATIGLEFWQLLVLVFLGAFLDGPGRSARQAMYPELIQHARLDTERANTWFALTRRIASVMGAPFAGILIAATSATALLWLNSASFAVAAAITIAAIPDLRTAPHTSPTEGEELSPFKTYLRDVREGFRAITGNRLLRNLIATSAIGALLAEPIYAVILPVYANKVLGSAAQLGLIFGALGAGSILGNLLYLALVNRLPRGVIWIGGFTVRALCFCVFLAMPDWWPIALAVFIGAVALEPVNPMSMSIFQEQVPAGMRGRVFGAQSAIGACAFPIGVLLYGQLLSQFSIERTLIIFVALNALVPLAMLVTPTLRHIEKPGSGFDDGTQTPPGTSGSG